MYSKQEYGWINGLILKSFIFTGTVSIAILTVQSNFGIIQSITAKSLML